MIGNNIKQIRESKGLKQSDLAEIVGVSDKTVSSWEINRTEPKIGMIEKIAAALQCKKSDIIGSEPVDYTVRLSSGEEFLIECNNKADIDIRRIQRAREKMSEQEKERMMKILELSFNDYFGDNYIDEDND